MARHGAVEVAACPVYWLAGNRKWCLAGCGLTIYETFTVQNVKHCAKRKKTEAKRQTLHDFDCWGY